MVLQLYGTLAASSSLAPWMLQSIELLTFAFPPLSSPFTQAVGAVHSWGLQQEGTALPA